MSWNFLPKNSDMIIPSSKLMVFMIDGIQLFFFNTKKSDDTIAMEALAIYMDQGWVFIAASTHQVVGSQQKQNLGNW